jgi:hypothetical protein
MNPSADALLAGEPAESSIAPTAIPAAVAALDLEREQHEFHGPMDVVKGLLMWDETTEERVRKNLSQPAKPAESMPLPSQTPAANRPR